MKKIKDQKTDVLLKEKPEHGSKPNRANRNKSEKDRRDKVNAFINELATLVSGCSPPTKKLDKATILKNTVDFMKVHNDLTVAITHKDTTSCLNSNELGQLLLEGYHAFLFVISLSGNFKFFSESVHDLLGYMKDELIEDNIFDYVYPEDQIILKRQISQEIKTGNARSSGSSSFYIRFKAKNDERQFYETLCCCGNFRTIRQETKSSSDGNTVFNANETCYVVLAKLVQPSLQRDVSKWLHVDVEFTSRQSLDGKFLYLDPRCIPITGYFPYEILETVLYEYVHFDDLENVSTSFEAVLEDGAGETEDYRILTKGSQWIIIKTSSYISYNQWNSKPEFICSTHQLVRSTTSLRNGQTQDAVANKANSTGLNDPNKVRNPYYTAQKMASPPRTGTDISQTTSHQNDPTFLVTSQNVSPESGSKNPNLFHSSQQSNRAILEMQPCNEPFQFDLQSPSATTFWSGQNPSESIRFQNPLVTSPTSPQQNNSQNAGVNIQFQNSSVIPPTSPQQNISQNAGVNRRFQNPLIASPTSPQQNNFQNAGVNSQFQNSSVIPPTSPQQNISQNAGVNRSKFQNSSVIPPTSPQQNISQNAGINRRFQNSSVIPPASPQENIEVFTPSPASCGNGRTDPKSPRVLQGYIEPRISNARNMWQTAERLETSSDTQSDFSQPSCQMARRHYSPSPVTSDRHFQSSGGRLNNFSLPTSSVPQSKSPGGHYSKSPTTVHVMSPQVAAELTQSLSPIGYPTTPTQISYAQSPSAISPHSPQHHQTDRYSSLSSLSPTSPQQKIFQNYSIRPPLDSPQIPEKYPQSPSFTSVSPHPASPHTAPHTLDNSSQSPHYSALSPAPTCHESPPRAHHISNRTNEVYPPMSYYSESSNLGGYPMSGQSNTYHPQSPCEFPVSSPQTPNPPTERHQQSTVSPNLIPQNITNDPRSLESNPVRSTALGGNSSQRSSAAVYQNLTQFSMQSNQHHMSSGYHQAQFKKSAEESLQPCQVKSGIVRRSSISTSGEILDINDQSQEHVTNNMTARRHNVEMLSSTCTIEGVTPCVLSDGNTTQNVDCENKTSEQQDFTNKQYLEEQEYQITPGQTVATRQQNSAVNTVLLTKSSSHLKAQIILQNQLLDKQNQLQDVIQKQKAQLSRIQEQIILNAQAQLSLHEVGDLESTKAFQQQVYDLEIERKQHETRQKALKSVFLRKLNGLTAHNNDGEVQTSSPITYPQNVLQHLANTSNSSDIFENSNTNSGFSSSTSEASAALNSLKTRVESPGGSYEFVNKRSPQGAPQTNLGQELGEDLFSGVLTPDTRQSSDQCYTHTGPLINPPYKTSTLPLKLKNNDTAFSGSQNSILQTRECAGSSTSSGNDYFSKFSASELETFLSSSSFPPSTSTQSDTPGDSAKEEETAPSTYDSLLLQQKRLLEIQEEQRRELVRRQEEQLLRLQQQQQQQQRMLVGLQHTSQNTPQDRDYQSSTSPGAGGIVEGPSSSFSQELNEHDLQLVNMLLAEGGGTELWTGELFDDTS